MSWVAYICPTDRHADLEYAYQCSDLTLLETKIDWSIMPNRYWPLGCGLGGLPWQEVRQRMQLVFQELPDVLWLIYEPTTTPRIHEISSSKPRPKMTKGRAVLINASFG